MVPKGQCINGLILRAELLGSLLEGLSRQLRCGLKGLGPLDHFFFCKVEVLLCHTLLPCVLPGPKPQVSGNNLKPQTLSQPTFSTQAIHPWHLL